MATEARVAETEELVFRLYQQGTTKEEVEYIAEHLRRLQLSQAGWQVANHLLKSSNPNVRFFAANTFTIKLNNEGVSLTKEDLDAILERLLESFVSAVSATDAVRVAQKLCVALAALFFLPNYSWENCIRHLVCCLHAGHVITEPSLSTVDASKSIKLEEKQLTALLLFSTTLAEDAQKIDHSAQRHSHVNGRIKSNIPEILVLMRQALFRITNTPQAAEDDALELLDCFQAWAIYALSELRNDSDLLKDFKLLLGSLLSMLTDSRMFVPTAVFLRDILGNQDYTGLLLDDHAQQLRELLFSGAAEHHLENLMNGSQERNDIAFGELCFAFGFHSVESGLMSHDPADALLTLLHHLTRTMKYDSFDESLGDSAIDFWECYNSHLLELDNVHGITASHQHWMLAIEELCGAVRVPFDGFQLDVLDRDDPFNEFRVRILDVINDAYDTVGPANLKQLLKMIQEAHPPTSAPSLSIRTDPPTDNFWSQIWTILQPLEGMYETVVEYRCFGGSSELLSLIFTSKAFDYLLLNFDTVPKLLQNTVVSIVGEYGKFIGHDMELIFKALNILVPRMSSSWLIARSVSQLCEQNRGKLIDRLDDFMEVLQQDMKSDPKKTSRFLLKAVAAIVQALPNEQAKVSPLVSLLESVKVQYERALDSKGRKRITTENDEDEQPAVFAMEALKDISIAMLSPDDAPIVLDDDDDETQSNINTDFWTTSDGQVVRQGALTIALGIFNSQNGNGELLTNTCEFLSQGLRERSPGPFVFLPDTLVAFLRSIPKDNPRLDTAIQMATRLVSSRLWKHASRAELSTSLYEWIFEVIESYQSASKDPDVSHRVVEFLERIIASERQGLLQLPEQVLETFFTYALQTLQLAEPLPKTAAAKFWTALMSTKTSAEMERLRAIQASVGAALTKVLVDQIGGHAARSDLSPLAETVKVVVFGRLDAKRWLDAALSDPMFPGLKASDADKRAFIAQVISLQGNKRTLRVIQDFYAICRGTPSKYN